MAVRTKTVKVADGETVAADAIVQCFEAFVTSSQPNGPIGFAVGDRLRADHPVVAACGAFFVPDGTPVDVQGRLRSAMYRAAEAEPQPEPDRTRIEKRIPDEDALVTISGPGSGVRVHKQSPLARANPKLFVPVVAEGLDRRDALVAIQTCRDIGQDGETLRILYSGQWCHRDDPFVTLHPHNFVLPHVA